LKIDSQVIRLTFLGGAFGTLLRFGLFFLFGDLVSTLLVNLFGAALIGWLNANPKFSHDAARAFWKTGFTGGFTTMSGVTSVLVIGASLTGPMLFVVELIFLVTGIGVYLLASFLFGMQHKNQGPAK
jgi:fluoride ion exporter CrcB/FEX